MMEVREGRTIHTIRRSEFEALRDEGWWPAGTLYREYEESRFRAIEAHESRPEIRRPPPTIMSTTETHAATVHCPSCGARVFATPGARFDCPGCGQGIELVQRSADDPPRIDPPRLPAGDPTPRRGPAWSVWDLLPSTGHQVMAWVLLGACLAGGIAAGFIVPIWGDGTPYLLSAGTAAIAALFYAAPSISAYGRGHHNSAAILLINMALGWTLIGWIVAAAWASTAIDRRRVR